jgi:hypothetical protein
MKDYHNTDYRRTGISGFIDLVALTVVASLVVAGIGCIFSYWG